MTGDAARKVNPLLFIAFCPHCFFSGVFALAATGAVTLPTVLGVHAGGYLPPLLAFGTFFAWLTWGILSKRGYVAKRCRGSVCGGSSRRST